MMNFNFGIMPYMGMNMCRPCTTPDYGLWRATAPYNFTTNFGGQVQFNTYPASYSFCDVIGARNAANPFYYSNYFLNTFMSMLNDSTSMQQAQLNSRAAATGYAIGTEIGVTSAINATSSSIASLKYQIENALKNSSLNDEQKTYLEELKKGAEELEEQLNKLVEAKKNGEPIDNIYAGIRDLNSACTELGKLKDEYLKKLSEEAAKSAEETTTEGQGEVTEGTSSSNGGNVKAGEDRSKKETTGTTTKSAQATTQQKIDAKQICTKIDRAIYGPGTNYSDNDDGLLNVMKQINADNVMTVVDTWNNSYAKKGVYAEDEKGFIEALMDDCEDSQKEEIATILIDALEQRANNLGIDVDAEVANARISAHSNWIGYRDDDDICDAVNSIIKKIHSGTSK